MPVEKLTALPAGNRQSRRGYFVSGTKLSIALKISHRLYVMGHAKLVYAGTPNSLLQADDVPAEWLEV
jgi:ABC-type branched-subunit amino acid transport system ATPase component